MDANYAAAVLVLATSTCVPRGGPPPPTPPASGKSSCLTASAKAPSLTQGQCPIITCGDNAPNAGDSLLFDELDLAGSPNYVGVHLDGSRGTDPATSRPLSALLRGPTGVASIPARIEIEGDTLAAYDTSSRRVTGTDLIGTVIRFQQDPSGTRPGTQFELRVACYDDTNVKFRAGRPDVIPAYDFQARRLPASEPNDPDAGWFEVCNQVPLEPDGSWTSRLPALVYRGDRYVYKPPGVPGGKRVDASNDPASGWSFMACNGSAASKMHLFRHTFAGGMREFEPRTALLKAITADYCGDGLGTYTRPGNPLAFAIAAGGTSFPDPYASGTTVEAIWNSDGAVCIDRPRLVTLGALPCSPETCDPGAPSSPPPPTPPATWTARGYVLTANPPPR